MPKQRKYNIDGSALLKKSVQNFDDRKTFDPKEGDPSSGKWNTGKKEPTIVTKWVYRKPGAA